jgi:hypothetical protein
VKAEASQCSRAPKRLICSLRSLADTCDFEAYSCWRVASQLWPEAVVGSASLYVQYLRKVWEAVSSPVDGVLLARVLADEGVIGAQLLCSTHVALHFLT